MSAASLLTTSKCTLLRFKKLVSANKNKQKREIIKKISKFRRGREVIFTLFFSVLVVDQTSFSLNQVFKKDLIGSSLEI